MDTLDARRATQHAADGNRPDGPQPAERSARAVRWFKRVLSTSLLTAATVVGVQLGLDAPAVSPVSPAAIAEQAALLSSGADETPALRVRHGRDHDRGRP